VPGPVGARRTGRFLYDRPMAEEFCDVGRGVTLCYETFGDPDDPPILLIMGLATQMIAWHEDFCEQLAKRGFYVVRFDNRDIGRSTHFDFRPPSVKQMLTRRLPPEQYSLSDMAEDSAVLLRELEIAPAHVVGASMGGMIGQMLAAEHPELVRSLTSIMSTTGNRWRGQPALSVYRYLMSPPPRDRDGYIQRSAEIFGLVGSTGFERDEQYIRERAARSFDRGFDVRAGGRQLGAIVASGDRTKTLGRIKAPTLVIHGTVDKMIRPSGGRATAKAIPGARLMMIEGMGHDLPRGVWPQLIEAISEHARAADVARAHTEAAA
jgi:pimeloyl-ACP methyl ester carboxylesterase